MIDHPQLADAEAFVLLRDLIRQATTIDESRRAALLGRLDRGGLTDMLRAELVALIDAEAAVIEADIARSERLLAVAEGELAARDGRVSRADLPPSEPDDGKLLEEFARRARWQATPEERERTAHISAAYEAARDAAERRAFWREVAQAVAWSAAVLAVLAAIVVHANSR